MTARDTLISREENLAMFNDIAGRYDLMNKVISFGQDRGWRKTAVRALAPKAGGRYLDIGCGTADLALDILKAAPDALVTGIDPSAGMLGVGKNKVRIKKVDKQVTLSIGDAVRLPFADNVFDGIILGFVIRNVEQRNTALKEMYRVIRPSGRLVILELGVPKNAAVKPFFHFHTRTLVPLCAKLFTEKGAYDYLIRSVEAFPPPDAFLQSIRAAGFTETKASPLTFGAVNLFYGEKPDRLSSPDESRGYRGKNR